MDRDVKEAWAFVHLHRIAVGDEHPTRRGWFLKDEPGDRGEPIWFRPSSRLGVWVQRVAFWTWICLMAFGLICALLFE